MLRPVLTPSDMLCGCHQITDGISPDCLARYNKLTDFPEQPVGSSRVGLVSDEGLDGDLGGP